MTRLGWSWRGVRARTAVAAAAVAAILLCTGMLLMRQRLYEGQMAATSDLARRQVDSILQVTSANTRLAGDYGSLPYELVGGDGTLISSSNALKPYETDGRPVMPSPGFGGPEPLYRRWTHDFQERPNGGDLSGRTVFAVDGTVSASFVSVADGEGRPGNLPGNARYRVYVFVTTTSADTAVAQVDPFLIAGLPLSVLLVAATASLAVARSLRPVEAIRARTAAVTANDPHERVDVPRTGDEIEALAVTINDTLQRLDKAARDQRRFVADAAHELRAPITNLRAGLDIAQAYPDQADFPGTIERAARSAHRLHGLADDLLLLARLDAGEPLRLQPLDLVTVVAEAAAGLREARVRIALAIPEEQIVVCGHADRLDRLLRNLLDNAVRHAATTVRMRVETATTDAVVTVYNDGTAIPADKRDAIFDRFTRLDDARGRDAGGSGLGLTIARDIAVAHRGALTVTPTVSSTGTTFELHLPLVPDEGCGDNQSNAAR